MFVVAEGLAEVLALGVAETVELGINCGSGVGVADGETGATAASDCVVVMGAGFDVCWESKRIEPKETSEKMPTIEYIARRDFPLEWGIFESS